MQDLGLLVLRLTMGGLVAGHGAMKLFGWFEGHGLHGTAGFFESALGLRPGERWALTAGAGEMSGGLLTALGLMHPIGPLITMGPMITAWGRAHWGKPIWVTSGGAELPLTNLSIALALTLIGPGRFSIDHMFGIRVPAAVSVLVAGGVAVGAMTALTQPRPQPAQQQPQQATEPQPTTSTL